MTRAYEHDGDSWEVYLGADEPHAGVRPLIFTCTSNSSNGWRVLEVQEQEYAGSRLDDLSDGELDDLFDRAAPFDYPHDPKAEENSVGDTPLR